MGGLIDDPLVSFFFYSVFVFPACGWILKPGRFPKRTALWYAIGFLATIAALKTGLEVNERGPNHYQVLDVARTSNPLEIKRAYKRLSLELHPDKNPSPEAADLYVKVKDAYDVLMDMEGRAIYNKFGDLGIKRMGNNSNSFDETQMLLEIAIFYVTWAVLAFMLTIGKSNTDARTYVFTGMIAMLVVEVSFVATEEAKLPEWFLPLHTEYELVWLLHTLFPAFLNGCRSIGSILYADPDAETRAMLKKLNDQNADVLLALRDLQIAVAVNGGGGGSGGGSGGGGAGAGAAAAGSVTPTGKLKELRARGAVRPSVAMQPAAKRTLGAAPAAAGGGNYTWYGMVVLYVGLYYAFGT